MSVRFWEQDVDANRSEFVNRRTLTHNPENAPDPEALDARCRPWVEPEGLAFDRARDALLDEREDWSPTRHPSQDLLDTFAAHNPAARTGTPRLEPGVPAPERPSRSGAPSSHNEMQPRRGHAEAA